MSVAQTTLLNRLSWLMGGFLLGMLCIYSIKPSFLYYEQQQQHRVAKRDAPTDGIMRFGNPGPTNDFFERTAYTLSYDRRNRIPNWVGEHLTAQSITKGEGVSRSKSSFKDDRAIPALFRGRTKDYVKTGYDRGHMAPADDGDATQAALDETFLLSNMAPQIGIGFNRHYWAYLEGFCRNLTTVYTDVYVYTGPLILPTKNDQTGKYEVHYEVIGNPSIAVPTHFYKIVAVPKDETTFAMGAFLLPNQNIDSNTELTQFSTDVQNIEVASGLTFFSNVDRSKFLKLCDVVTCKLR
ncbi:hypothetical protein K501DRAFT_249961 [Backusella circina FSU 941]|nr:hypothetical protein K501DRAFT_249961 [Backusella circina FSU 941]